MKLYNKLSVFLNLKRKGKVLIKSISFSSYTSEIHYFFEQNFGKKFDSSLIEKLNQK